MILYSKPPLLSAAMLKHKEPDLEIPPFLLRKQQDRGPFWPKFVSPCPSHDWLWDYRNLRILQTMVSGIALVLDLFKQNVGSFFHDIV